MSGLKLLKLKENKDKLVQVKYGLVGLLAVLVVYLLSWWSSSSSLSVFNFVFGKETSLKTEKGRINVLLLGMAGGKHEGATLTDTIMVASYELKTHKVNLISIPRDIWIDKHKVKVNTLYQVGLAKKNGLEFARKEIGEILGITLPYGLRIDFNGFVKAIDLLGEIDINIPRSFEDYHYPIEGKENDLCDYQEKEMEINEEEAKKLNTTPGKQKVLLGKDGHVATASGDLEKNLSFSQEQVFKLFPCRFEQISFDNGLQHMDGETALKFVRSRNGTNNEGSDFARSKRQQLVLQTFKDKVLSIETLTDLNKIVGLVQTFGSSIESDIPQNQYLEFAKIVKQVKEVKNFVIDSQGSSPLLMVPPAGYYGAWVLIPQDNDFSKIHQYINDIFLGKIEASESAHQN